MLRFCTLIILAFVAYAANAQMLHMSDQQLIQSSEGIISGEVVSSTSRWVNNNKFIYTFSKIKVNEVLSGDFTPGEIVTIVTPGGYDSIQDIGMRVSHQAVFKKGEEALVFVKKAEGEQDAIDFTFLKDDKDLPSNIQSVAGHFQGKRKIILDPATKKKLIVEPNEEGLIPLDKHNYKLRNEIKAVEKNSPDGFK